MLLNWFDATEAKEFGASLAKFYIERVPPKELTDKKEMKKEQEALEKILLRMAQFRNEKKLNVYKTAQLCNVFKWTLKEAGYDSKFIDQITQKLVQIR